MTAAPAAAAAEKRDQPGILLNYFRPDAPQEKPGFVRSGSPVGTPKEERKKREEAQFGKFPVTVVDARTHAPGGLGAWKLEEHGFCFMRAPEPITDFKEKGPFLGEYVPRLVEAVQAQTKASRVFYMSNQYRTEEKGSFPYAFFAHSDFGPEFEPLFRQMLVHRYGVEEEYANSCGVACVNLWVPIERPAYDVPLCLLDYSSIQEPEKEILRYQSLPPESGGMDLQYNTKRPAAEQLPRSSQDAPALAPNGGYAGRHRWVFCSDMRPDEAWLFKQYDWRPKIATRVAFHSAFRDAFRAGSPGRRSIDCRLVLCYDPDEESRRIGASTTKESKL